MKNVNQQSVKIGIQVAPSMEPTLKTVYMPEDKNVFNSRSIQISLLAIVVGMAGGIAAQLMMRLIWIITNLTFYGKFSFDLATPTNNHLGLWVVLIPVGGALVIGLMAKYGSAGIRGDGIPEAMTQVLANESRIQPSLTLLKPISAAISIGTGGPFGAEGPIIATGGALGSLVGQLLKSSASERKILLASGAAAGLAATFGCPIAAVMFALELLLFEFSPQSLIPVTLASVSATAVRIFFEGTAPLFAMNNITEPGSLALTIYLLLGGAVGICSVFVTKAVYWVEDNFEKLPIHWMWWPAIGAVGVGIIGYFVPHTFGVGYDNINNILNGTVFGQTLIILFLMKFASWTISLGSGTSGGTLAPLFIIGGGLGATLGSVILTIFPNCGVDVRIAGLVGMAAMFAGSARTLLASMIFAFETTRQPFGLLPLLAGCSAAYLISSLIMKHNIMTEKIHRKGVNVPLEYEADFLTQLSVRDYRTTKVYSLKGDNEIGKVREWLTSGQDGSLHHGYPVVDKNNQLIGIVSRRELENPALTPNTKIKDIIKKPIVVVFEDNTLREVADMMALYDLTRLPVVSREDKLKIIGIVSRDDILRARRKNFEQENLYKKYIKITTIRKKNNVENENQIIET